jgi:hypothetical protein
VSYGVRKVRALTPLALEQAHFALADRHGERKARKPRSGAEVGDRRSVADRSDVQRHQRVGEMQINPDCGIPNRRRGAVILRDLG